MSEPGSSSFRDADWSVSDELLVATEHMGFVRNLLSNQIRNEINNPRLGLTRLQVARSQAARVLADRVSKTPGASEARRALQASETATTGQSAAVQQPDVLGRVARDIRALAISLHSGWTPTIGRNRLLSFPGSITLGATREISFGSPGSGIGASREISFGAPGGGRNIGATREISFGGGSVPTRLGAWKTSGRRPSGPGKAVRIGVLDTGIWPHPWLAGGWVSRPSDVLPDRPDLEHVAGHGTFVAGLILHQAPGATLEIRRVLDDHGHGTAWEVAEAIVELGQSGVDVLNLSFSCYTADARPPLALARAVDRVNADVVVVAAAGNHAMNDPSPGSVTSEAAAFRNLTSWPAGLDDVIAVGALTADDEPASFSPEQPWVDVATRGVYVRSTYLPRTAPALHPMRFGSGWAQWSGTSFSAALVSGAVAAGIDPGRVAAPEAAADLLATAVPVREAPWGQVPPPRLHLRLGDRSGHPRKHQR